MPIKGLKVTNEVDPGTGGPKIKDSFWTLDRTFNGVPVDDETVEIQTHGNVNHNEAAHDNGDAPINTLSRPVQFRIPREKLNGPTVDDLYNLWEQQLEKEGKTVVTVNHKS